MEFDITVFGDRNIKKLKDLRNPCVEQIIDKYVNLCKPSKVTLISDSDEDIAYLRERAIGSKEEKPLKPYIEHVGKELDLMQIREYQRDGWNEAAWDLGFGAVLLALVYAAFKKKKA